MGALVWLHAMGPVPLSIGPGSPMSLGGVLHSELPGSDSLLSCLWGCAMYISKFLWTTQLHLSPCHGLIVYTGRFLCCLTTTYLVFSQQSPIMCFPPNTFCLTRQRPPSSSLEALIFWSYQCLWQVDSLHWLSQLTHSTTINGHWVLPGICYESTLQLGFRLVQTWCVLEVWISISTLNNKD